MPFQTIKKKAHRVFVLGFRNFSAVETTVDKPTTLVFDEVCSRFVLGLAVDGRSDACDISFAFVC